MNRWENFRECIEDYLNTRRRIGYQLKTEGEELHRFARFADEHGNNKILTIELALAWANTTKKGSRLFRARRLEIIRGLAKFCSLFEPKTQIPPPGLLGPAHRRVTPHIYKAEELIDLMKAANNLQPRDGLRPATMQCLIGLLSATGLRISEALRLTRADVDFEHSLLVIRETKFSKSRYVPLHPTTVEALEDYDQRRDRLVPVMLDSNSFFLFDNGRSINYRQALYAFQCIRRQLGWETQGKRSPRIHDLRHTFTCNRILSWYKEGIDVNNAILMLSVYLGHSKVTDTYWYLTGIPSLMAIASDRFDCLSSKSQEVQHE